MLGTRMTTLAFFLLDLFSARFVLEFDYVSAL